MAIDSRQPFILKHNIRSLLKILCILTIYNMVIYSYIGMIFIAQGEFFSCQVSLLSPFTGESHCLLPVHLPDPHCQRTHCAS